jgi:hypothetical protein
MGVGGGGGWHGRVWSSVGRDRCVRGVGRRTCKNKQENDLGKSQDEWLKSHAQACNLSRTPTLSTLG